MELCESEISIEILKVKFLWHLELKIQLKYIYEA